MSALESFQVTMPQPVAWGEMDALRHVNNVVYFRYFETVRIEYFNRIQLFDVFDITKSGPVLRDTSCQFRRPVVFPETLTLGARVEALETYGFTMAYAVVNQQGQLTTTGSATVVMFDFETQKKILLPEELRQRIQALDGVS